MNDQDRTGGWTVVLRRRPARLVAGRPEGGYTGEFEIVCCYCGDNPGLDYREVSPELQRIRGPYPVAAGITAYVKHARRHPRARKPACPAADARGLASSDGTGPSGTTRRSRSAPRWRCWACSPARSAARR